MIEKGALKINASKLANSYNINPCVDYCLRVQIFYLSVIEGHVDGLHLIQRYDKIIPYKIIKQFK